MNFINNKLFWVLVPILMIVLIFLFYCICFFRSQTDTNDVIISGFVYDLKTKKTLGDVNVKVFNYRFEDDHGFQNYDEYLGFDTIYVKTSHDGTYKVSIPKSAFIRIYFIHDGFISLSDTSIFSEKKIFLDAYLIPQNVRVKEE
ncbi:MAG: hypothetical protein RL662_975 [Bacteroidota bacterium]